MAERKKIGELLVEAKILAPVQLQSALAHQKQWGGRIGSAMQEMGFVDDETLAKFLGLQRKTDYVSLAKLKIPPEVLRRVPHELQVKHFVVPIEVRKEGKRESLMLAMRDPADVPAIDEIGFATGLKVKPVIATELSIKKLLQVGAGTYRERTVERELNASTIQGNGAPLGEAEIVLDPEVSGSVVIGQAVSVDEVPISRGTLSPLPRPGAVTPPPAPAVPSLPPTPPPDIFGTIPAGTYDLEDHTEPDIPIATGMILPPGPPSTPSAGPAPFAPLPFAPFSPFAAPAPPQGPPIAPIPTPLAPPMPFPPARFTPDPPTATRPSFQPLLEEAWETQPGAPDTIGGTLHESPAIIARGAMIQDEPMDEISLPGPEPLAPPADLLVDLPLPSRSGFSVPADIEMAEPTVLDDPRAPPGAPLPPAMPDWGPAAAPEPLKDDLEPDWPEDVEFLGSVPAAPGFEPPVESMMNPAPEAPAQAGAFSPPLESLLPEPPVSAAASGTAEPLAVEDALESVEPLPPVEGAEPPAQDAAMTSQDPTEPEAMAVAVDEAECPPPEQSAPPPQMSTTIGAIPVGSIDAGDEGTMLNAGAFEPTWNGEPRRELDEIPFDRSAPVDAGTGVTPGELPSAVPTVLRPDRTRTAFEEHVPAPAQPELEVSPEPEPMEAMESALAESPIEEPGAELPPLESAVEPEALPPQPAEPASEPAAIMAAAPEPEKPEHSAEEWSSPGRAMGISEEQAALNQVVSKKLKLLNAIAELLLEKGLVTEEEIKEKIGKKRGS